MWRLWGDILSGKGSGVLYERRKLIFHYVQKHLRAEFPQLVSYNRFVELMPGTLLPMCIYLYSRRGHQTGLSFVDSTPIAVCHNKRIRRHKTFAQAAGRFDRLHLATQ